MRTMIYVEKEIKLNNFQNPSLIYLQVLLAFHWNRLSSKQLVLITDS